MEVDVRCDGSLDGNVGWRGMESLETRGDHDTFHVEGGKDRVTKWPLNVALCAL